MDCINILKYLNIFLTTFFTFLLALFAFFQWRAVEKQNKQNLFKMRLEHCSKFNSFGVDIIATSERVVKNTIDMEICREFEVKIKNILYQLYKIIPEASYLFNNEISNDEKIIVDGMKQWLEFLENRDIAAIEKINKNELEDIAKRLNEKFTKFLK